MKTPRSKARSNEPRCSLTRRRVSASTTPIDSFGNDWSVSYAVGSTPISPAKVCQMASRGPPRCSGSTWTRSEGTSRAQRRSTSRRSRVRQFQMALGLLETVRA